MNFRNIVLGQSVIEYEVPINIYETLNNIYEKEYKNLIPSNKQLVGKIKKENSLFYDGNDEKIMKRHTVLPNDIINWFVDVYKHYLQQNKITEFKVHLNAIWVNDMIEHEYNPIHIHSGTLFTGLSSVMILKLPDSYGVEYSAGDHPQNGRLSILGSSSGQFAKIDFQPEIKERSFFVFPYDVRHSVNPFNGPGMRRTLAANCDVDYNPVLSRGVA